MAGRKFYYYGASMRREFRNGEELLLEEIPYSELQKGDIVAVLDAKNPYVHRIIQITAKGAITRGDNNAAPDTRRLLPEDHFCRVTHAISLQLRIRKIAGGKKGMRNYYQHQTRRTIRSFAGKVLRCLGLLPN
ncbi:MAG: hypothetical protein IJC34_03955 [Lentisphaeria bacterium]|nr:hypothetical protein [Lentisphaeria bacterium]